VTDPDGVRCAFEHDDGAYILGALSPAERAAYERHLAHCPPCKQSLAELAVLPGLLGRLNSYPPVPHRPAAADEPPPATLLPRLLAAASTMRRSERRAQRRRRLRATVAAALASLAVATAAGIGVHLYDRDGDTPALFAVPEVSTSPEPTYNPMWVSPDRIAVNAQIAVIPVDGGTLIVVRCHHDSGGAKAWPLWLIVYPRDEEAEPVGSWLAIPGKDLTMTGLTHYPPDEIDRIEVQDYRHTTLLWWHP